MVRVMLLSRADVFFSVCLVLFSIKCPTERSLSLFSRHIDAESSNPLISLWIPSRSLMLKTFVARSSQVLTSSLRSSSSSLPMNFLDKYDPQQVTLLYEPLIVVDKQDRVLGQTTKKDAHLLSNIENLPSLVHRAFSFFLFDHSTTPSRLVLQQRSPEKITYPSLWANTCCSHPLHNEIEMNGLEGVKHAVRRRVQYELGYDVKLDLIYQTKIFYQARNIPDDGIFGESEVDYIIVAHYREKTPLDLFSDFKVNTNEIQAIRAMTLEECRELVEQNLTTPWFTRIVHEGLLAKWWAEIDQKTLKDSTDKLDVVIELWYVLPCI